MNYNYIQLSCRLFLSNCKFYTKEDLLAKRYYFQICTKHIKLYSLLHLPAYYLLRNLNHHFLPMKLSLYHFLYPNL